MIPKSLQYKRLTFVILLGSVLITISFLLIKRGALAEDFAEPPATTMTPTTPLCRFGVNVLGDVNQFDTESLRMGWYVDYAASANPVEPNGSDYAPIISLTQVDSATYSYTPNGSQLNNAIAGNPGVVWFIGNEPDRRFFQDDIEPHLYAEAYHELYQLIKAADSSAQIFAGTIVQPTPLRLQYLDMVLVHYANTFSETLPVDGWSIHNFILNEVSCDYDPNNCWGAGIPPGIDADFGEILSVEDNDSIVLFKERIERFRQWMFDNGYANKPLFVSEFGVLMPEDYGFPASRVNTFMNNTFDYMLNTIDNQIGDPNDGHRLVQKWSWYSTGAPGDFFNGYLFDPDTKDLSAMGQNFASYTAAQFPEVDLYPERIFSKPNPPFSQGENVTFTLKALISNYGILERSTGPIGVRFYNGDPTNGGIQIGSVQTVTLSEIQSTDLAQVVWSDVSPGSHQVFVTVDTAPNECYELNNIQEQTVLVATERRFLPISLR